MSIARILGAVLFLVGVCFAYLSWDAHRGVVKIEQSAERVFSKLLEEGSVTVSTGFATGERALVRRRAKYGVGAVVMLLSGWGLVKLGNASHTNQTGGDRRL